MPFVLKMIAFYVVKISVVIMVKSLGVCDIMLQLYRHQRRGAERKMYNIELTRLTLCGVCGWGVGW